ncbi:Ni/Fe-hydrogenase, b-type cytochrome subunit [Parabacteroides sp. AM08-6]|uniref:Ni/Fe-hydrogenase, b-type cytochrome subunit n=1 Tax=Parabacteroides sp. AM08-6 TaxID=2292053 RepID=UPI000F004D3C|nr:Ni/Fe-hydrogenase, b-type cytochrome subunit [Parabacteroides sp. AM08-6]RHJ87688.1 Ni/Fe-hydrogenase, b-type cytochrome subunit [Parabacteroides sp. AM08-6]
MKSRKRRLREVYVWELPVRFYHWLNALCIIILCITGFIIADPPAIMTETEASFSYWFGIVRFIHFVTAFVFFFNFVFRIYWGFVGNRFARWNNFIQLKKSQWKEILQIIKVDILMIKSKPIESIGHNALASLIYFVMFLAFLLQSITGFGLYAKMSESFFPQLFAWTIPVLGGDLVAREIHHFLMWFFILFAIIHIYLVCYHDYIERRGEASSMIGGWKFVEESRANEEEVTETAETITKAARKNE